MRCGHGWEEEYEIEHGRDDAGHPTVVYKARGIRVPSPLSQPHCSKCGGNVVRIMRPGRVDSARPDLHTGLSYDVPPAARRQTRERAPAAAKHPVGTGGRQRAGAEGGPGKAEGGARRAAVRARHRRRTHHWHLSDLLRLFRRRR
nr:hypothetical protein [Streptomyces sp. TP-A0874]